MENRLLLLWQKKSVSIANTQNGIGSLVELEEKKNPFCWLKEYEKYVMKQMILLLQIYKKGHRSVGILLLLKQYIISIVRPKFLQQAYRSRPNSWSTSVSENASYSQVPNNRPHPPPPNPRLLIFRLLIFWLLIIPTPPFINFENFFFFRKNTMFSIFYLTYST